jgi:hypothetical protein
MSDQAIMEKLDRLENFLTNHVMTEIANNREQIVGMFQTIIKMYDSQQHTTENVGVLADRVNQLRKQLVRLKVIS